MTNFETQPMRTIFFILFFALSIGRVGLLHAQQPDKADEPLVLELRATFGSREVRQAITVVESQKFLLVTDLGDDGKWKLSGDVGDIVDGVAKVNLSVEYSQQNEAFGLNTLTTPRDLRVDEFLGGGDGANFRLLIADVWLRRGLEPVPVILKALSNRDEKACVAANYLARLGPEAKEAVEQLANVLKEPDFCPDGRKYRSLKMEAAKALGAIGAPANESAIPSLVTASSDANGFVRVAASQALWATSKRGKAIPSLIKCLKDDEGGVRFAACAALEDIGQDMNETEETEQEAEEANAAIEALASALVDQQSRVRFRAVLALEQFGLRIADSPSVVAKLKKLLDAPDANVQKATARVLKNLDL